MSSNIYKNKKPIIFFLVPAFAFLAIFLYYPFLQNILNSFKVINNLGSSVKAGMIRGLPITWSFAKMKISGWLW